MAQTLRQHVRALKNAARRLRTACNQMEAAPLGLLRIAALADIERDSAIVATEAAAVLRLTDRKLKRAFARGTRP